MAIHRRTLPEITMSDGINNEIVPIQFIYYKNVINYGFITNEWNSDGYPLLFFICFFLMN